MYNLYKGITNLLARYRKEWMDVLWIGSNLCSMSFEFFKQQANQDTLHPFGNFKDDSILYIVGKDWWLEREDEFLVYYTLPSKPSVHINS